MQRCETIRRVDARQTRLGVQQLGSLIHPAKTRGFKDIQLCADDHQQVHHVLAPAVERVHLHSAAAARNLSIMTMLLTHGASPNVNQQPGWTPLHSAAQHGDKAMAELLLAHGAGRSLASNDGTIPAALAAKNDHAEVARLLS